MEWQRGFMDCVKIIKGCIKLIVGMFKLFMVCLKDQRWGERVTKVNWEEQTWENRGNMIKPVSCEQTVSSFVSPDHREEEQVQAD